VEFTFFGLFILSGTDILDHFPASIT